MQTHPLLQYIIRVLTALSCCMLLIIVMYYYYSTIMNCKFFQVIIAAAVLLVDTTLQIPDCKDQRSVFTAEPISIEVTCRAESVLFPCEHKFGSNLHPLWIINDKIYESSQLPQDHHYDGKALSVKNLKLKQNNTSYQCVIKSPTSQKTDSEATCFYRSAVGYLWKICEAPKVQCSPIYRYETGTLKAITTNITKVDTVSTYTITFSDALSGNECGSASISAASCIGGICSHDFEVPSESHQSNCNSDINVTVSTAKLVQSESLKIDHHNTLVKVLFDMKTPSITCQFINQPKKSRKYYTIQYGLMNDGCKDLPHDMEGYLSNANSVTLQLHLSTKVTAEICFTVKAHSGSKTVIVEGVYKHDVGVSEHAVHDIIAATTVIIVGVILSLLIFSVFYKHLRPAKSDSEAPKNSQQLVPHYSSQQSEREKDQLQEIDMSTTFYKVHAVMAGKEISMKRFASKFLNYRYYDPQDGFGYFHATGEQLTEVQCYKKVILMDKSDGTPKFSASKFNYCSAFEHHVEKGWGDVYVQDKGNTRMLKPGMRFLYCARSKRITKTSYFKHKSVAKQCNVFEFAEEVMAGFQEIWIRYLYFQFADQEDVRPDQRIIVQKKDGELVTGPGVRHLLGATGDCSLPLHLHKLTEQKEWEKVFIQATKANRELKPDTELLFCALMEKIPKNVQYSMYDIPNKCKMADFGAQEILGFNPEMGYGYYEFKEEEYLNLDKNVVLMHKDGPLYSGPGAKFFCTGDYSFDYINDNKIPPPSLDKTDWSHIFIQNHSEDRELLPGTKFLHLEYQTAYMKDDDDDEDTFRYTWSSS